MTLASSVSLELHLLTMLESSFRIVICSKYGPLVLPIKVRLVEKIAIVEHTSLFCSCQWQTSFIALALLVNVYGSYFCHLWWNKLECFNPARFFIRVRLVEQLTSLSGLSKKHQTIQKKLSADKHSSLFGAAIGDNKKKVYNIDTMAI